MNARAAPPLLPGAPIAARLVPPSGSSAWITGAAAAAMAFLAVFALALGLAADRLATRWAATLERSATLKIAAPAGQMDRQTEDALAILGQTPGIEAARLLDDAEVAGLLAPWLGAGAPLETLDLPRLVAITASPGAGFDAEGLRLRLAAEVPGASLDDHARWRLPLMAAATHLRLLAASAVGMTAFVMAAIVALAASAAIAANVQVVRVLRLVGARDRFIAGVFVRRFVLRAFAGASVGTLAGMAALAAFPEPGAAGALLADLGLRGRDWALPAVLPPFAALVALVATLATARARLGEIS